MHRRIGCTLTAALAGALLVGCTVATDALNPDFLAQLGFDPATIVPPKGRVVIVFNNQTGSQASFQITVSDSQSDPTSNAIVIPSDVLDPGETQALTLECPLGTLTPGGLTGQGQQQQQTAALTVIAGQQTAAVNYTGAPLVFQSDFFCGDLIELRAVEGPDAQGNTAFSLEVRVLPGR